MIEIGSETKQSTIGEMLVDLGMVEAKPPIARPTSATNIPLGPGRAFMKTLPAALDLDAVVIEKGVEMPAAKTFQSSSAWLPLLKKMQVGDSVFFADASLTQMGYARTIAKKHDFKISIRAVTGGVRLWRVAAPGENESDGL